MARKKSKSYKMFSDLALPSRQYAQGSVIKMQILKKCEVGHSLYGDIKVDQKYFDNVIRNFKQKIPKEDLPVNEEHERSKAQAWFSEVMQEGNKLYANLVLTKDGAENINGGHYKYFSIEIFDKYEDQDTRMKYDNVLVGGAFTNYPFFRGMDKAFSDPSDKTENIYLSFKNPELMETIKALLEKFKADKKLSFADKKSLFLAFNELTEDEQKEIEPEVETAVETVIEETPEEKKEEPEEAKEHSDPEKVAMQAELAQLKSEKRFSEVQSKYSAIELISKSKNFSNAVKVFANLNDEQNDAIISLFSEMTAIVDTLKSGQISAPATGQDFSGKKKETKDGKEVVTEKEMASIVAKHAKEKGISETKAYEALKDSYCTK